MGGLNLFCKKKCIMIIDFKSQLTPKFLVATMNSFQTRGPNRESNESGIKWDQMGGE